MVKAHTPINWENEPSYNTPLNAANLNKMDSEIGILDDRIIEQDTIKLDKATANTMVKAVSFDENTGVFTITLLNGSTTTIDTKLEKVVVNFDYDANTQQIILNLVDGTTQYIDLSALITHYEFVDSDTIGWEVTTDGKVKAKILDGSITENMLQPNYLADIRVETAKSQQSMENAKISETNAKESELLAKQYAEDANMYESMVADTVNGNNPTATNSTDGNLIYLKNSGYTRQDGTPTPDNPIDIQGLGDSGTIEVRTQNKNWLKIVAASRTVNGITLTVNEDKSLTVSGTATVDSQLPLNDYVLPYGTYKLLGDIILYKLNADDTWYETIVSDSTFVIDERCNRVRPHLWFEKGSTINKTYYPMILLADETDSTYEPCTETTATIPIDTLYEGDYLEVYADGSGKIVRNMGSVVLNGSENWNISIDGQWYYVNGYLNNKLSTPCYSEYFVGGDWGRHPLANTICVGNGSIGLVGISVSSFESIYALKEWLQSHNTTVIYEQSTPTSTPLTAEQVAEFKKLQTFKGVTNVIADGEVTVRYYCNNDSGETVNMIQNEIKNNIYTKKETDDKIRYSAMGNGEYVFELTYNDGDPICGIGVSGTTGSGAIPAMEYIKAHDNVLRDIHGCLNDILRRLTTLETDK